MNRLIINFDSVEYSATLRLCPIVAIDVVIRNADLIGATPDKVRRIMPVRSSIPNKDTNDSTERFVFSSIAPSLHSGCCCSEKLKSFENEHLKF